MELSLSMNCVRQGRPGNGSRKISDDKTMILDGW